MNQGGTAVDELTVLENVRSGILKDVFVSEEGKQVTPKEAFVFTRAYNERIKKLRSSGRRRRRLDSRVEKEEGKQVTPKLPRRRHMKRRYT